MDSLVLGTAGHIDHGKTTLVKALTGVDTDRLKEERERGITIDLGFARLDLGDAWAGVVDVPGHEGFIRNMVAGAAGIDAVLLVVAADEGVMPQTREHLDIIELLGVRNGIVALTKADLVDDEWLELVADDVRDTLRGTAIDSARIIPTSTESPEGTEDLRASLVELLAEVRVAEGRAADIFRMPVDRSFTVRGTGTVATGTVWSGSARAGGQVLVRPGRESARVRGIEVHGETADVARAGERSAIALVGLGKDQVQRGAQLITLRGWEDTSRITARVRLLPTSKTSLDRGRRVRLHLGTAEVMARAFPLGPIETLEIGQQGWVEIRLEAPVLARARDRFVLRSYSPMTTIGGGIIGEVHPPRRKLRSAPLAQLDAMLDGEPRTAIEAALSLAGWRGIRKSLIPVYTGVPKPLIDDTVGVRAGDVVFSTTLAEELQGEIGWRVSRFHEDMPLEPGIPVERLRAELPAPAPLVDLLIHELESQGTLCLESGHVSQAAFAPTLSAQAASTAALVRARYKRAGLTPPPVADLGVGGPRESDLWGVVRFLTRRGELIQLEDDLFIWHEHFDQAVDRVRTTLGGQKGLGPADFRGVLQVSRRYMLPLLHRLDQDGVTVRQEGSRSVPA